MGDRKGNGHYSTSLDLLVAVVFARSFFSSPIYLSCQRTSTTFFQGDLIHEKGWCLVAGSDVKADEEGLYP